MPNGRPGPEPRLLPGTVTEEQLRQAVAASRSWRGVLLYLGLKSSSFGPKLRNACNSLDVDYTHFRSIPMRDSARSSRLQATGRRLWRSSVMRRAPAQRAPLCASTATALASTPNTSLLLLGRAPAVR